MSKEEVKEDDLIIVEFLRYRFKIHFDLKYIEYEKS